MVKAWNCLAGCIESCLCPSTGSNLPSSTPNISQQEQGGPIKPQEGDILSPWVELQFGEDARNPIITVGNESSAQFDNHAVVKSFEFGLSDGIGFSAEIIDEEGGAFTEIANRLWKCMEQSSKVEFFIFVQFGWTIQTCNGDFKVGPRSPQIQLLSDSIEIKYADGKIAYTISGIDQIKLAEKARYDDIQGSDDHPITLKQAIRNLCKDKEPKFEVNFVRIEKNGARKSPDGWEFFGGKTFPTGRWTHNGHGKLTTILEWISGYRTDQNKGMIALWNPDEQALDLVEDPKNDDLASCGQSHVGTYIVNGGACSPVISFNPNLNWQGGLATLAGATGDTSGATSGKTIKKKKDENIIECQGENAGLSENIVLNENDIDTYGADNASEEREKSQRAQRKAHALNWPRSLLPNTAERVIMGDLRREYMTPVAMVGKFVSIIVINPFHILGTGNGACNDWLAKPPCNEILTNKMWLIMGVHHSIKLGSFTTTLELTLVAPGIDFSIDNPVGGTSSVVAQGEVATGSRASCAWQPRGI